MDNYEIRLAISADISALYDLLNENVNEHDLEEQFTNSRSSFEEHFIQGLFRALLVEVQNEAGNKKEIVGCIILSICYEYVVGLTSFPHCCYVIPTHRSNGLEQKLIQRAKKMCRDANIDNVLTVLTPQEITYRTALKEEGAKNLTTDMNVDAWIMTNHSATSSKSYDDYILRDGTEQDLEGIYHLLEELAEMEELTAVFKVTKEEFKRDGAVDKDLFGSVIVEHRCRVDEHKGGKNEVIHELVGCSIYSKMYYALLGKTYFLQGIYIKPSHKGKGLGKNLLRVTLEACKKRRSDGFFLMIFKENKISQSLFRSMHATNLSQPKYNMDLMAINL